METDYTEIYETWDSLPDCRIRIPGEVLWGKELPDGTFGINNVPLHSEYRYQDIVRAKNLAVTAADELIVHRRFAHSLDYTWTEPRDQTQATEIRRGIVDALTPLGVPGFYYRGSAYLLVESGDEPEEVVFARLVTTLKNIGVAACRVYVTHLDEQTGLVSIGPQEPAQTDPADDYQRGYDAAINDVRRMLDERIANYEIGIERLAHISLSPARDVLVHFRNNTESIVLELSELADA